MPPREPPPPRDPEERETLRPPEERPPPLKLLEGPEERTLDRYERGVLVRLAPELYLEGEEVKARERPEDRDELTFRAICCREAPERLPLKLCAPALLRVRADVRCGVR